MLLTKQVIFILVGIQGILLGGFLLTKKSNQFKLLAAITLIIAIDCLSHVSWINEIIHLINHGNLFALGPLTFVFYESLRKKRLFTSFLVHLTPFFILKVCFIAIELLHLKIESSLSTYMSFLMAIYNIVYSVVLIFILYKEQSNDISKKKLLYISLIFLFGWLVALVARISDIYINPNQALLWSITYVVSGVLVYYLTLSFLLNPRVFADSTYSYYKNKNLENRLISIMESEQLYLDPSINRDSLASKLGISAHELSFVLNKKLNITFNDLINSYRIKYCINYIESDSKIKTLSAIGLDCGFGSKTTFQRAFKKHTGLTPKEFLKKDDQKTN
ncbi:AraC family transcriptional regulator [Winogradskyella sp.]|uniref:helix-turn-helix domain-containing protein n=1 Tax=Winogradskyella sp. TaxID=1883156 RepID=UPI002603375F|nr:helix-turn-helix domain-containing protein [Winogradskyella sp.]